jgi:hypothetical protein
MQRHSTIAQIIALVAIPVLSACTVTVVEDDADMDAAADDDPTGSDSDGGASDTDDTDEPTSESDGGASETDDDTNSNGDEPATDGGGTSEPEQDAGGADAGDASTGTDDETGEDSDGGATEDPQGDAGGDDPTEEGDGGGAVGGTIKTGYIALSQQVLTVLEQQIVSSAAGAGFSVSTYEQAPSEPVDLPCETETSGLCVLQVCETSDGAPTPGPTVTSMAVSAGDISITGLSEPVTLSSDESNNYTPVTAQVAYWEGGEAVVASAPGSDDVPAFELELTAPSAVTLVEPELSLLAATEISRAADLRVAWSEGDEGTLTIVVADSSEEDLSRLVTCTVPVADGEVEIDQALLAGFGDEGAIAISLTANQSAMVEDWNLTLSASSSLGSGAVTFTD